MESTGKKILILGAGEKASAVAHHLFLNGFKRLMMADLPLPRAERRGVCFCEAAIDRKKEVCGVTCERAEPTIDSVNRIWSEGNIPLLIIPCDDLIDSIKPDILIDALMAKRNTGTSIDRAPFVIALGPGFCAGKDAHYVIETNPNSKDLGKIIEQGFPDKQTDMPTKVTGISRKRILRSPETGTLRAIKDIGDAVQEGDVIGYVEEKEMLAPISGVVWGIIRTPADVRKDLKVGDIHPGNNRDVCFKITPHAKRIAEAVHKAILKGPKNTQ